MKLFLNNYFSVRFINFWAFLIIIILLSAAMVLQKFIGLEPCPLCIAQRIIFFGLGILFLIGIFLPTSVWTRRIHSLLILIMALLGVLLAARQIWIRHLPPGHIPPCAADFYYMVKYFPFKQTLLALIQGTAECTKDTWTLFGIDLPTWSLLWFVFFMMVGVYQLYVVRMSAVPKSKDI